MTMKELKPIGTSNSEWRQLAQTTILSVKRKTSALLNLATILAADENTDIEEYERESDDSFLSTEEEDYESESESDDSFSLTEEEEKQETLLANALVKAAFDRTLTEPVLTRLVASAASERPEKRRRLDASPAAPIPEYIKLSMRMTQSEPALATLSQQGHADSCKKPEPASSLKPEDFLRSLLEAKGKTLKTFPALSLKNFFHQATDESVDAFSMEVTKAVRQEDVDALRHIKDSGKTLQCANRFGESIVHIACRRGALSTLKFLLDEANVSCRVCCDYGRTSLHDACWTSSPNFQVIGLLLDACPDLLYTTDKRGSTPLAYVRPDNYQEWCDFLNHRGVERLAPLELF
jgi:hypothetical protein